MRRHINLREGASGVRVGPTWLNLCARQRVLDAGSGYRVGGGAGLVVGLGQQGRIAEGSESEIRYAATGYDAAQ